MDEKTIVAFVHGCGDNDVGIPDVDTEVDTCIFPEDFDSDLREFTRDKLEELFTEIWDCPVGVSFSDECPECGKTNCKRHCMD